MLDSRQPIELPGLPGAAVRVFRDSLRPGAFYVMPSRPHVARDDSGRPSVSTIVYGRQQPDQTFEARGAVLTLTTMLGGDRGLDAQVRSGLARWLSAAGEDASRVEIAAVEWLAGTVTLSLTSALVFTGRPSLTGVNACAFNERIAREQANPLIAAWRDGLPEGRIRYEMRARTAAAPADGSGEAFTFDGPIDLDGGTLAVSLTQAQL